MYYSLLREQVNYNKLNHENCFEVMNTSSDAAATVLLAMPSSSMSNSTKVDATNEKSNSSAPSGHRISSPFTLQKEPIELPKASATTGIPFEALNFFKMFGVCILPKKLISRSSAQKIGLGH